jgi:ABC-2 type transport system permease protein
VRFAMPAPPLRWNAELYWQVARRGFRRFATYRAATFAGVFTNTVFGFLRAYVFVAVFAARGAIGGYDARDTLTFTFVAQGLLATVYMFGWWEIALGIRSGDVVTDLYRPYDYQGYWLAQDLGRGLYHALYRGIPPFLFGLLVFRLLVPHSPLIWAAFVLSMALAICVSFALRFLINLSAFWLLDYRGPGVLMLAASNFLSGMLVPITFFPGALRTIATLLPFAAVIQTPVDVWLGKDQGLSLAGALAGQAAWAIVLLLLGRLVLRAALKKLVVQGG